MNLYLQLPATSGAPANEAIRLQLAPFFKGEKGDQGDEQTGALLTANDLSDLNDASAARGNLGVAIGSDVQAYSAILDAMTAAFTTTLKDKLDVIQANATANDTDANLLARGNHTGTQLAATISDFEAAVAAAASVVANTAKRSYPVGDETKVGHISVTGAVDLDAINTRVNDLDAAIVLIGVWDASTGTFPGGGSAQRGHSYIVSTAGIVDSVDFQVNDRVIALTDNASTATYAANWHHADYTDNVLSVAGKIGTVILAAADIASGTMADARIAESNVTQHESALTVTESQISDLGSYLTAEANDLTAAVTWANVPDANITESSVTQHEAAITITESQISDYNPGGAGTVDTTGAPALDQFAAFHDADTIKGITAAAARTALNVADGATANSADAVLLDRANHTGTQTLATISDSGVLAALDTVDTAQIETDAITAAQLAPNSITEADMDSATAVKLNSGMSPANLSWNASTRTVSSSSGTNATLTVVDATNDGLMTVADKTKIDFVTITQSVDLDALETDAAASKVKTDFIAVTQAVDLDTIESDAAASKTKTDFLTVTQAVDLDAMETDVSASKTKTDFLTVTQAVDLDTIETDTAASKVITDHITVTQAVDLDAIESRVNELDAPVILKGEWDASAGTFPGGGTAKAGSSYIVDTAGTVDSVEFAVNDRIIALVDNASTATFAANWHKADYTDNVLSVAGKTGAVTLAAADIASGTMADARIAQSNITQHEAALTILQAQISDAGALASLNTVNTAQIDNNAVTFGKVQDIAQDRIVGRTTAGAGDPEELTAASVRTMINVADGATANDTDANLKARANHTGTQALSTISDAGSIASKDFWTGTQAAYDALTPDADTIYFIEAA